MSFFQEPNHYRTTQFRDFSVTCCALRPNEAKSPCFLKKEVRQPCFEVSALPLVIRTIQFLHCHLPFMRVAGFLPFSRCAKSLSSV